MNDSSGEPLEPLLHDLQRDVAEQVEQICETQALETLDTGELIRLEEKLSIAADVAKRAVSVRRRLGVAQTTADDQPTPSSSDAPKR